MYEFRTWLRARHYADQTIRQYVNFTRRAHAALGTLTNQDTETLAQWVATLSDSSGILARKALVKWYEFRGVRHNPALAICVAARNPGKPRPLTVAQRAAFLRAGDTLGGEHRVVAYLFEFTGARFSSVRFAHWRGVDLNDPPTWTFTTKGSNRSGPRTHTVPLHPALVDVLRSYREHATGPALLPGPSRGGVIAESRLRAIHDEVCDQAGLVGVVPHQHRATVATITYDETGDIAAVSELLGHANIATTREHYTRMPLRRVIAAVETLTPPEVALA